MTLKELEKNVKPGNIIESDDGILYIVTHIGDLISLKDGILIKLHKEHLKYYVKVYKDYTLKEVIWEKRRME